MTARWALQRLPRVLRRRPARRDWTPVAIDLGPCACSHDLAWHGDHPEHLKCDVPGCGCGSYRPKAAS